jgi:hypothetical protein
VTPTFHHPFWRPANHNLPTARAAFRPEVNHPIGFGDHDHAVAAIDQAVQHVDEFCLCRNKKTGIAGP